MLETSLPQQSMLAQAKQFISTHPLFNSNRVQFGDSFEDAVIGSPFKDATSCISCAALLLAIPAALYAVSAILNAGQ